MVLVTRDTVGAVALRRMVAAGVLTPLTADAAIPTDVPYDPVWRALALREHVPAHTVLSGLAGLWVHCGGPCPAQVVVVGRRGLHRTVSPARAGSPATVFHSGPAHREPSLFVAGLSTATTERCATDALRWDDHRAALPAVVEAVRTGRVCASRLADLVACESPSGARHRRLESAWQALVPLLVARPRARAAGE